MNTSGTGTVNAVLYVIMLACSIRIGCVVLGVNIGLIVRRIPPPAVALWLMLAIPSLSQMPFPGLVRQLQRDPDLIRDHGQWWRIITSVAVQDGGLAGTVFNLAVLAMVGVVAIRAWGAIRALAIILIALVAFNFGATFLSPSAGAGNSAATFALATSIIGLALVVRRRHIVMLLAGLTSIDGIGLLALHDAHGEAVVGGLLIGSLIAALSPPKGLPRKRPGQMREP